MNSTKQPTIADLTSRALAARADRFDSRESAGDVEPHEVVAGIRVDAVAAWADAQLPLKLLGFPISVKTPPPEWPAFAELATERLDIPMAAGHFPQRLREVACLFVADLAQPPKAKPTGFATLKSWITHAKASGELGTDLLARGLGRELGETSPSPSGDSPTERNESAANLWAAGQREAALSTWQAMPASPVASFNVGMALLMLGRAERAVAPLQSAAATLPEASGWQHLASLYLAVARVHD